jgi:hypothetical protein
MATTKNEDLKDRLAKYRQITLNVIGRKTRRTTSRPVWFVVDGEKLYLLPVRGSVTQWYRNVHRFTLMRAGWKRNSKHVLSRRRNL